MAAPMALSPEDRSHRCVRTSRWCRLEGGTGSKAHVFHPPPNDENAKLLAKLDQRLREVEGTQRLVWDIIGREAVDKVTIVAEVEEEQVKVPYHLPLTTPFAQLE
ncbi:hypothetical protein NL676_013754 [Syzygium grande]|nr:hypothetical protein NL676_013754 [Syzygium grande]